MIEYAGIYLKNQGVEYSRNLNSKITEQLSRQTYSEHCQTIKIERF